MRVLDHFRERVAERCPEGTNPVQLARAIAAAIRDGRDDLCERVMRARHDPDLDPRTIWRFKLPCGTLIYPVVCDLTLRCVTLLTQEQMRSTKAARKTKRSRKAVVAREIVEDAQHHARKRAIRLRKQGRVCR